MSQENKRLKCYCRLLAQVNTRLQQIPTSLALTLLTNTCTSLQMFFFSCTKPRAKYAGVKLLKMALIDDDGS